MPEVRIGPRAVATATPDESVREIVRRMAQQDVGCVVVVDSERKPVGIATDRDIVTRNSIGALLPRAAPSLASAV